jgi:hypothetical protein
MGRHIRRRPVDDIGYITFLTPLIEIATEEDRPLAKVREHVEELVLAAVQTVQQPAILLSDKDALAYGQAQTRWRDEATAVSEAAALAGGEVVSALHASRALEVKTSQASAAKNGRRSRPKRPPWRALYGRVALIACFAKVVAAPPDGRLPRSPALRLARE